MKYEIEGINYIPATKVMQWLAEAREIVKNNPVIGEERFRITYGYTRYGYKESWIPMVKLFDRIEKYPHTSFQNRPELMELVQRLTKAINQWLDHEARKTVEVIRLSDGVHKMVTPEVAEDVVEMGVAKYA